MREPPARLLIAVTLIFCWHCIASVQPGASETVLNWNFEEPLGLKGWNGAASVGPGFESESSLALASATAESGARVTRELPVEELRGAKVRCTVMVKAEGVSPKPNSWNGIKLMLVVQSASGVQYPQAELDTGTFGWRKAAVRTSIPLDATNVTLLAGLENVRGKAWFDDLAVTMQRVPTRVAEPLAGPRHTGHRLERLRGAMVSPRVDAESLRVLGGDWNANLIRYQLIRTGQLGDENQGPQYDSWLEGELKRLDELLPKCEEYGLLIALDLHSPPGGKRINGGYYGSDAGLFTSRAAQDQFVEVWRRIARRYMGKRPIWAFDLANEPVEGDVEDGCMDWAQLSERTARAIRQIDPLRTLIIEPADWGNPAALKTFVPLPLSNVVYSVHMYLPHAFTHQNVHEKGPELAYPGDIRGERWDKAALERAVQPALDFQKRYNVHLYIGEFSAIRWAPDGSAARYLSDVIDIFEKNQWDWSYHAFREWHGWSVEHGDDPRNAKPSPAPTDRQQLLQRWFKSNQKP